MSTSNVLRLDEYRDRRDQRLRLATSFYYADRRRHAVLEHLGETAVILSAGRAAMVWVDEFGPGMVHPYVVLDLSSDRPRRSFSLDPLNAAWEGGVPGIHFADDEGRGHLLGVDSGCTMAIALGSDGTRAWFLVADSVTARRPLLEGAEERLMFLAGECSAVVLHRDLDESVRSSDVSRPGFPGWPILQDVEGREDDDGESRRIGLRFIVGRLPRLLVDDDLTIVADGQRTKAQRAREEIAAALESGEEFGPEAPLWEDVLSAFESGDLESLGRTLVMLGENVEAQGHHHGAIELYRTAYEISAAVGHVEVAVDAARFSGRVLRRLARWADAQRWYEVARRVAEAEGLDAKVAVVLVGVANIHRERGSLPTVRATLAEALPYAQRSDDPKALGQVHHARMALEHRAGALETALESGWQAVRTYQDSEDRVQALADLAGVLTDLKELDAAEDAWNVVLRLDTHSYYRLYAVDALGHIAALRGDAAEFERRAAEADAMAWETGPLSAKAEILYYRGLSYRALGSDDEARYWLRRAVSFCEDHAFNRTMFSAETALRSMDETAETWTETPADGTEPLPPAMREEVCNGLHEWRLKLAGAGA